ncbi:MAG: peptidylprolyl isomerase [Acidobacteriota bacterium]
MPTPTNHRLSILIALVVSLFFTAGAALAQPAATGEPIEVDRIVLRINDQILTLHEYESRKSLQIARLLSNQQLDPNRREELLTMLPQQIVKSAFEEMLLTSRAKQTGVFVDDQKVEEAILEVQANQGISSRQELLRALADAGLSIEELRENLRRELMLQAVMGREVHSQIVVGEEELRGYYRNNPDEFRVAEERQLREVIVLDSAGVDEERRQEIAQSLKAAMLGGADASVVVNDFGDQGLTTRMIDLGWLEAGDIDQTLAETAFGLENINDIGIVEARGGLHVIQVLDVKASGLRPFSEVQDEIMARERGKRFRQEMRRYMGELVDRAYIVENLPSEAVGYRALVDFGSDDELEVFQRPLEETDPATELEEQLTDS